MNVLLSAYACDPRKGSEHKVGWNWLIEIAKLGHKITVIKRTKLNEDFSKIYINDKSLKNVTFVNCKFPKIIEKIKKKTGLIYVYYFFWQIKAFLIAKKLSRSQKFDLVHHITFVSIRSFSFMWLLDIPFIYGPIAGGDKSPYFLRWKTGIKGGLKDSLRDIFIFLSKYDPLFNLNLRYSSKIFVCNKETLKLIPQCYLNKTNLIPQIGINPGIYKNNKKKRYKNIIFVGRFLYWKGMKIGLEAFQKALQKDLNLRLTMVGSGPEFKYWFKIAQDLKINSYITWKGWVNHADIKSTYQDHGVLLHPSLHDSGGQVILEAMSNGLPVCCLDLGGPGEMIDGNNGISINCKNQNYQSIINALSDGIIKLTSSIKIWNNYSSNAYLYSRSSSWESRVKKTKIY